MMHKKARGCVITLNPEASTVRTGCECFFGFRGLGFRGLGFRGLGFRGLGFRGLGFRGLGFRGLGFLCLSRLDVALRHSQHSGYHEESCIEPFESSP